MKHILKFSTIIFMITNLLISPPVFSSGESGIRNKSSATITAANPQTIHLNKKNIGDMVRNAGLKGSLAFAHNAWNYQLFTIDVESPFEINIVDTTDFQTFCGDFEPGNTQDFFLIQYPENMLKTINTATGEHTDLAEMPVPLTDGVWVSLSIHKSTGEFFAIATDGLQSVMYSVNKSTGETLEFLNLGLQAAISASFDASGALYVFDIDSDSTFVIDLTAASVTGLGPSGFDGNYAQGMGYDPLSDEIYLSAYEELVGPQLRLLNRLTGEASFLTNLPGETAAFGFPTDFISPVYEFDFGDALEAIGNPFSYPTTLAHNGASHHIDPAIFLGDKVDGEPDGQPDANAQGDDKDILYPSLGDDEDGVSLPPSVLPGTEVSLNVKASANGYLDVWMDFDLDQTWFNPNEHIFAMQALVKGNNKLYFVIPPTAAQGLSFLRFRFRSQALPLSFDGMANDGEVEDYVLLIKENTSEDFDYGDAPQGYGSYNYKTIRSDDGARHKVAEGVFLGTSIDAEPDGQPVANALGDDNDLYFPAQGDDEDGVILPSGATPGEEFSITVLASVDGYLDAWMDFNLDGDWDEAEEHLFDTQALISGDNLLTILVPLSAESGLSYLRFRFRKYDEPISWYGLAENGEVEDYALQVFEQSNPDFDFGDAPEGNSPGHYPTLLINNGARHIIVPEIYLGAKIDAEPNGQPSIDASGDDNNMLYPSNGDDEDGVIFSGPLVAGATASLTVTASVDGFLNAWVDFNIDGTWNNSDEKVLSSIPVFTGENTLTFSVPTNAEAGISFARFRFQDYETEVSPEGLIENGEVEDYVIQIQQNTTTGWDFGDAPDELYPTLLANDGARHLSDGITFLGASLDTEADAKQSVNAKGDDLDMQDDEDGVIFQNPMTVGGMVSLQLLASTEGMLNAWIDFDENNSWSDADEHIFVDHALNPGINTLFFSIPEDALPGETFLRFRFSSQGGLSFTGAAENGEVEDYMATIYPSWSVTPTTITHTISIPTGLPPLQSGDLLGVFFTDTDGSEKAAGTILYTQGQIHQMIAFGDNPASPDFKEGFAVGEALSWKIFLPSAASVFELNVVYDTLYPDQDGTFTPFGFSALSAISYQQNPCPMPLEWEYSSTGSSHNINIPLLAAPEIFSEPLEFGDWIGAFYKDDENNESCGGAVQWNGVANVVLTAFGDDNFTDEKDGFESGENFIWKLYRCESAETYAALATYNQSLPCQGSFGNFCLSELNTLQALYQQSIPLFAGWNSISTYLVPLEPAVENLFEPFQNELIIMKNLESLYWPYAEANTIGNWDNTSGYAIKVEDDFSFELMASNLADQEISLSAGWHYLPVLSGCPVNADELFAPVLDKITLVQDIIGTKVWWPEMGVYTLHTLLPGKSYKIRIEEDVTLYFPDCTTKSAFYNELEPMQKISVWGEVKQSPSSHTLSFLNSSLVDLITGDFLGAFNESDQLCGFLEIDNSVNNQAMVIFGDDPSTQTKVGFSENEKIYFKVFSAQRSDELELDAIWESHYNNSGTFHNNGISVIKQLNIAQLSSRNNLSDLTEIIIYPNPTNGAFAVSGMSELSSLTIFDTYGKEIKTYEMVNSGEIDLSGQTKGIYYIRIEHNSSVYFEKLILN